MKVELKKTFSFEAAHRLTKIPDTHKCSRLHGHSFKVEVAIFGEIDEKYDWLVDFGDIKKIVQPIIDSLDHRYLNEIEGLSNPTSENIARWLWNKIKPKLGCLSYITVKETETSSCTYFGNGKFAKTVGENEC